MYAVIEFQNSATKLTYMSPVYKDTLSEAEQVFHQILMYAAVSEVPIHGCMILDALGNAVRKEVYDHTAVVV